MSAYSGYAASWLKAARQKLFGNQLSWILKNFDDEPSAGGSPRLLPLRRERGEPQVGVLAAVARGANAVAASAGLVHEPVDLVALVAGELGHVAVRRLVGSGGTVVC